VPGLLFPVLVLGKRVMVAVPSVLSSMRVTSPGAVLLAADAVAARKQKHVKNCIIEFILLSNINKLFWLLLVAA
jgi:hypothetical protein